MLGMVCLDKEDPSEVRGLDEEKHQHSLSIF